MQESNGLRFGSFWEWKGRARLALAAILVCSGVWIPGGTSADEVVPVYDRIEEDWELVVGEPDPDTHAPQIINVISPTGTLIGKYAILELNHSTQPEYDEGGMQLQLWSHEDFQEHSTPPQPSLLSTPGETVRYTLAMAVTTGQLKFWVLNGSSTTWGSFGGVNVHVSCSTQLMNLNRYTPATSTAKSRVAFAGHRVEKFVLKRVRFYMNGEVVKVDEVARQVHPVIAE